MMTRQLNSSTPISGVHGASHKGNADALILSVMVMIAPLALIAVSILGNLHRADCRSHDRPYPRAEI